jgi:hypothetical protein
MNPIPLTKEQKEHLIEMCNHINPYVKFHFWVNNQGKNEGFIGYNETFTLGIKKSYPALSIHWFEYTILTLLPALIKDNYSRGNIIGQVLFDRKHPIDILWVAYQLKFKPKKS